MWLGLSYASRNARTRDVRRRHSLGLRLRVFLSLSVFLGLDVFLDLGVLLGLRIFLWLGVLLGLRIYLWRGVLLGLGICFWLGVLFGLGICLRLGVLLGLGDFLGLRNFLGDFLGPGNFLGPGDFSDLDGFFGGGGLGVFFVMFFDPIFTPVPKLSRKSAIERVLTWKCDACPGGEILKKYFIRIQ